MTITANDGVLILPTGVAFDAAGNLWVSNNPADAGVTGTVVMFSPAQLAADGMSEMPDAAVTIRADAVDEDRSLSLSGSDWCCI